jgi:DNA-binding GntR family transcriptional regulator
MEMYRSLMWSSHGFRLILLEAADFNAVCEEHRAVAQAIRARDAVKAREAMMSHIEMIRSRVEMTRSQ